MPFLLHRPSSSRAAGTTAARTPLSRASRAGRAAWLIALAWLAPGAAAQAPPPASSKPVLKVEITSPLGRTGVSGPVRIVARIAVPPRATLSPVQFFVDGKQVGQVDNGPPYAVEWTDENPYENREIVVQASDSLGESARDRVELKGLEIVESASVSGVLVEPLVEDENGRTVKGLVASDFHVSEDGVPQTVDQVLPDPIPATYTLLVDSSQSMSRHMDFEREAAAEFPRHVRPADDVMVVPFSKGLGAVTGPTRDRDTLGGAIDAIRAGGGTSILDCLVSLAGQLKAVKSRHVIILITDGYDEDSTVTFEKSLDAVKSDGATVYVVAIGGIAGISLKGADLLRRIASETGGRAFFPWRDSQLADVHAEIAADVQERYLITYTPTNQKLDGTWRTIQVAMSNPTFKVRARPGYFAPAPPPIRPQLELTIKDSNKEYADITPEDLVVIEDGVEQKIEGFEEALAPVSVLLLLDASGSMKSDAAQVIEAARGFVAALPAKDSLGVMQFADKPELVQDLSTKREPALAAIGEYQANGGTALYDALWDSLARLKRVDTRRAIVLLTDGRDENNPGNAPGSTHPFSDVVNSLAEVDATVYGIGLGAKVDRATLERLAQVSGGETYFPEEVSSLAADYKRILENLRRRYIILYTSTNSTRDGKWRKVEIRSKRTGILVESKGGYFAPEEGK